MFWIEEWRKLYGMSVEDAAMMLQLSTKDYLKFEKEDVKIQQLDLIKLSGLFCTNTKNLSVDPNTLGYATFFDFDHTLVSHEYPKDFSASDSYFYNIYFRLLYGDYLYAKDRPVMPVVKFLEQKANLGERLFCLSHRIDNLGTPYILKTLKHYVPEAMFYAVDSSEHKVDFMKAWAIVNNVPLPHITMIDDLQSVIHLCDRVGIKAINTVTLITMMEETNEK